jgi:hypothetical protein
LRDCVIVPYVCVLFANFATEWNWVVSKILAR